MSSIAFTVLPPPEILKNDVECFRVATYTQVEELAVRVCPNGFPGIVFQQHEGKSVIKNIVTQSGRVVVTPTLFMHGQVTGLAVMYFQGPFATIQVILKPYALQTLFGFDASKLTDGSSWPDGFSGEELNVQLVAAADNSDRIRLFSDFLAARLRQGLPRDELVERSIDLVRQDIGSVTVVSLLEQLGISERQFERRFSQAVGVSPHLYIRVRRVNEAMRLMDSGQYERLTDVAQALNFHDQSHFIHDIKAFSGITPKSISQKANDFHRDQVGSSYMYR
jgi:AraC-like DNA-binding protein